MSDWQSIETCPHDVSVLLYGRLTGEVNGPFDHPAIVVGKGYNRDRFYVDSTDAYYVEVDASHWMPLPELPKGGGQ